jgi:hypothetical protein
LMLSVLRRVVTALRGINKTESRDTDRIASNLVARQVFIVRVNRP